MTWCMLICSCRLTLLAGLAGRSGVKMVVACLSAGTAAHWHSLQRDWMIQKCCVDVPPVVQLQLKVG